jgi:cell filamentation protein, protein adenylyltransferase
MHALLQSIAHKKQLLDRLRPLSSAAVLELQAACDIELTYTSNALEGNPLTCRETAEVIGSGATINHKRLKPHLEAIGHYDAVLWMHRQAAQQIPVTETVIRELHRRIVAHSDPDIAGTYAPDRSPPDRTQAAAPLAAFPNPLSIPEMMGDLCRQLDRADATPKAAFEAHFRLTAISPFRDANGRTARLLMNLLLLRNGYVPVAVRPEDRRLYLDALAHASLTNDLGPFQTFMHRQLDGALDEYIDGLRDLLPGADGCQASLS